MTHSTIESISCADATLAAAGLPSYTGLLAASREVRSAEFDLQSQKQSLRLRGAARERALAKAADRDLKARLAADAVLARIPS